MKKTINDYITYTILWCLILFLIFGCNTLEKAETKVLKNPASVEKIGREWEKNNPCVNDSTSKKDTTKNPVEVKTMPVFVPYYKFKNFTFDTLINGLRIKADTFGVNISGSYICNQTTINNTVYVTDNRRLGLARDTIAKLKDSIALLINRAAMAEANFEAAKDSIAGIHKNYDLIHKNVGKTFNLFISALWNAIKWWVIAILIASTIYTFRNPLKLLVKKIFF